MILQSHQHSSWKDFAVLRLQGKRQTCPPVVIPHRGWFCSLGLSSLVTDTAGRPGIESGENKGTKCLSKEDKLDPLLRRGRAIWKARMASPPAKATTRGLPISTSCRSTRSCPSFSREVHSSKFHHLFTITDLFSTIYYSKCKDQQTSTFPTHSQVFKCL